MTTLAVVFGTFNRLPLLRKAVESVRNATGSLSYKIIIVDGGSTDGGRQWLATQSDVVLIEQEGPPTGAVKAFNLGFSYAVEHRFDFVAHLNDDAEVITKDGFVDAINILNSNPKIGEVAFAFDLYGNWGFDHVNGKPYANFGVVRREAGEAVARAQGDPTGKNWWNTIYKTYGADSEFGVWLWKLGWEVYTANHIQVHDCQAMDDLRKLNDAANPDRLDSKLFWMRWQNETFTSKEMPKITLASPHPNGTNILVTGGHGFLGSALTKLLRANSHNTVTTFRSDQVDLRNKQAAISLFASTRPKVDFHLAAACGGIGANQANPATFFQDNMEMGMNVLEAAKEARVDKVVMVGTVCSYPSTTPIPFMEERFWDGYPEETNAPYGVAKRALHTLAKAYEKQYGLYTITALLANLYGPEDNFNLTTSHVIPALIRKFLEAKEQNKDSVSIWGTGHATREFLYVDDAAKALRLLGELDTALLQTRYDLVNIGTGKAISIGDLASTIARLITYEGKRLWDTSRPDGQLSRMLSISRAVSLGFTADMDLPTGLTRTIEWYKANQQKANRDLR